MIQITDNYMFEKDKYCYILYGTESKEKMVRSTNNEGKLAFEKTGEMVDTQYRVGYYASIEGMLKAAADDAVSRKAEEGQISSLQEYLSEYRNMVNELKEAVQAQLVEVA